MQLLLCSNYLGFTIDDCKCDMKFRECLVKNGLKMPDFCFNNICSSYNKLVQLNLKLFKTNYVLIDLIVSNLEFMITWPMWLTICIPCGSHENKLLRKTVASIIIGKWNKFKNKGSGTFCKLP